MIDIDYAGSPLVTDHVPHTAGGGGDPHPGQRYPDWVRLDGSTHHVLAFGHVGDAASLTRLRRRWSGLVEVAHDPDLDPVRAGVPRGGLVVIRPDGHIGFRSPSISADALDALDRHLSSHLIARRR